MKFWQIIEKFLYATVIVFLISITTVFIYFKLEMKNQCTAIAAIAHNENIIDYLNNWSQENIVGKGYSYAFGINGRITASKDGQTVQISQLPNSEITGIETERLWFNVHTHSNDGESIIKKDNISKLEFGRGRTAVILLKNNHKLDSYNGYTLDSGHIMKVNEKVYAFCDYAKF